MAKTAVSRVWPIVLLLAGCAQQQRLDADLDKLAATSITDLNAATVAAQTQGDVLAAACYPALAGWITQLQQHRTAPPIGVFSAFQQQRGIYKALSPMGGGVSGMPTSVKLGCAALYIDVKGDVVNFVSLLVRIASGTYVPPIP